MPDDTEDFHYPEFVEGPLRLEPNFTFPVEYLTERNVLEN